MFLIGLLFEQFTLVLWNPTIHPVVQHARVPVSTDYTVRDPTGQTIVAELIPISEPIQRIPGRTSLTQKQIIFKASLPALGFNTYYFEKKGEFSSHWFTSVEKKIFFLL